MAQQRLFMLLLGASPPGRLTEQHDIFFAIGESLKDLLPHMTAFWPEAAAISKLHLDAWRTVTFVDGYQIEVVEKDEKPLEQAERLFLINLGGYQENLFDERHYKVLTVQSDMGRAIQQSKTTEFFKKVTFKGANSHVDDKYGIDVDDLYEIGDILPADQKLKYRLKISKTEATAEDEIHLGYFKLNKLPDLV